MTPKVRDILIDARKQIHAQIADRACVSDTAALHVMDQLLTADAKASLAEQSTEEIVCALSDDTPSPYEEAERKELENKLNSLEAQREQDTRIINGLREELRKRKGDA